MDSILQMILKGESKSYVFTMLSRGVIAAERHHKSVITP
jgi:hypothetical protein